MNKLREEYVDANQLSEHLEYCYKFRDIQKRAKLDSEVIGFNAFLEDKLIQVRLTYKKGSKACTYIFYKDGRKENQKINGGDAFKILNQYYHIPRFSDASILGMTSSPFLYYNPKYNRQRVKAIGYDMNSAYSFAMLKNMPDTSVTPRQGTIKPGEIGFIEIENPNNTNQMILVPKFTGFSLWIFPEIESPFKKFVKTWYKRKQNKESKEKAKQVLNYSVGYLRKVNPFLYATILYYARIKIESLIDENTIYCNTDSIVSITPRDDLKLGIDIGEWKIEHQGDFAYKEYNYQWNLEAPAYRGKSKKWFKEGWDLLKDKLPLEKNIYRINNFKVEGVNYD